MKTQKEENKKQKQDEIVPVQVPVIHPKAKKLSSRKAKTIAYRYIDSWLSEACRNDTQFFCTSTEDSLEEFGYDVFNTQHRQAILSAFRNMEIRFNKEFRSWKPQLKDYSPKVIEIAKRLMKEGKL